MGLVGLISMIFLPFMYSMARASPIVCERMIFSMLADQPNLEVTSRQGEPVVRLETTTFSTLPSSVSFSHAVRPANSFCASSFFALSSSLRGKYGSAHERAGKQRRGARTQGPGPPWSRR